MGWMHDTLKYFATDPLFRIHDHNKLTFGLLYAYSEHFVLPLSHDEVVHMKGSLYGRMPGGPEQKFQNLRCLLAWMWAHPGRKLLFMGGEFGQPGEWNHDRSLDWHLLAEPGHAGVQALVRAANRLYTSEPALHARDDFPDGFRWLQADSASVNVYAFVRSAPEARSVACIANLADRAWSGYRVGVPLPGEWTLLLDTDEVTFGGRGRTAPARPVTEAVAWDGFPQSLLLDLPPLSVQWLGAPESVL